MPNRLEVCNVFKVIITAFTACEKSTKSGEDTGRPLNACLRLTICYSAIGSGGVMSARSTSYGTSLKSI